MRETSWTSVCVGREGGRERGREGGREGGGREGGNEILSSFLLINMYIYIICTILTQCYI